jgi:hypothetical protein
MICLIRVEVDPQIIVAAEVEVSALRNLFCFINPKSYQDLILISLLDSTISLRIVAEFHSSLEL